MLLFSLINTPTPTLKMCGNVLEKRLFVSEKRHKQAV